MNRTIPSLPGHAPVARTAVLFIAGVVLAACTSGAGASSSSGASRAGSPAAPATLEGTPWTLTAYTGTDGKSAPVPATVEATATFADGKVTGSAGCNTYTASYTVSGQKLTIGPAATTQMACPPPASVVEAAFLAALGNVASYAIDGSTLELQGSDGKAGLTFVATTPSSLTGTRWVATGVNNGKGGVESIVTGTTLTAIFTAPGAMAGSGGCNDYNGPYTTSGGTIKIGPLAATLKICASPAGVDDQEAQYFAALQKATKFAISFDTLELRDDSGALQASFRATLGSP